MSTPENKTESFDAKWDRREGYIVRLIVILTILFTIVGVVRLVAVFIELLALAVTP